MVTLDVGYYFKCIAEDLDYIMKPSSSKNTEGRIISLASRIFGGILAMSAVISFIGHVTAIPVDPALSLAWIIADIFTAILAHDFIRMGDNARRIQVASEIGNKGILDHITSLPGSVYDIGQAAIFEGQSGVSYIFQNTIITGQLARLMDP